MRTTELDVARCTRPSSPRPHLQLLAQLHGSQGVQALRRQRLVRIHGVADQRLRHLLACTRAVPPSNRRRLQACLLVPRDTVGSVPAPCLCSHAGPWKGHKSQLAHHAFASAMTLMLACAVDEGPTSLTAVSSSASVGVAFVLAALAAPVGPLMLRLTGARDAAAACTTWQRHDRYKLGTPLRTELGTCSQHHEYAETCAGLGCMAP